MIQADNWWPVETANCSSAPVHMWIGSGRHLTLKLLLHFVCNGVQKSSSTQAFRKHNNEILFYINWWNKIILK